MAEGYWEDVGTLEAYVQAHHDVLDGLVDVDIPGFRLGDGVWLGEGSEIDPSAKVEGPVIIGDYCRDRGRRPPSRSTPSSAPTSGSARTPSSIGPSSTTTPTSAAGVRLRGCVVGRSSDLRRGARCEEGVVLGDECFVGEHAVINPGVKVYPFKTVEPGAIVNSSIVWESRAPATSSAASASPAWPTSTSPRSWPCAWPWPTPPP